MVARVLALSVDQAFVGTYQVTSTVVYLNQFLGYLRPRGREVQITHQLEESVMKRIANRISAGVNAIGSSARLVDWLLVQGWVVTALAQAVALKIIAHTTGVFFYLKNSLDILEEINEVSGYLLQSERIDQYKPSVKNSMKVYKYSQWAAYIAGIYLGAYSGVQLGILVTGAVFIAPVTLNMFLTIGCVCLIVSVILRFGATEAIETLQRLRSTSGTRKCTFYASQ